MENENQEEKQSMQEQKEENSQNSQEKVSFPEVTETKNQNNKTLIIVAVVVILLAVAAYFILKRVSEESSTIDITTTPAPTQSAPTPTTAAKEIDRSSVNIQVLNGTGISGAASSLQTDLEDDGYTVSNVGNAQTQDYEETVVYFSESVSQDVKDDLTTILEGIYEQVDIQQETGNKYDVIIITGYPKNYSPTPTEELTPTESPTSTSSPTPTV